MVEQQAVAKMRELTAVEQQAAAKRDAALVGAREATAKETAAQRERATKEATAKEAAQRKKAMLEATAVEEPDGGEGLGDLPPDPDFMDYADRSLGLGYQISRARDIGEWGLHTNTIGLSFLNQGQLHGANGEMRRRGLLSTLVTLGGTKHTMPEPINESFPSPR